MKKLSALGLSVATYLSLAQHAFAQITPVPVDPCPKGEMFGGLCTLNFAGSLGQIVTLIFVIAILIALAFLIFGGVKWITSGGDKTGVEGARNTIVAALVGLVVVFLSYFILDLLLRFFTGQGLSNLTLPSLILPKT